VRHHVGLVDGLIHVEALVEEPGIERIVDAGNRTANIEKGARQIADDQVGGVVAAGSDKDIRLVESRKVQNGGVGCGSLIDYFSGKFAM